MKKLLLFTLLLILALSDICLFNISHFLGYYIANRYLVDVDQSVYFGNVWAFNIIWLVCTAFSKVYTVRSLRTLDSFYRSTIIALCLYGCIFSIYLFFTQFPFPIEFIATIVPIACILFISSRATAKALREFLPDSAIASLAPQNHNTKRGLTT